MKWVLVDAVGVVYFRVSVSVLPDSHDTQPGRLMTTWILSGSLAGTGLRATIMSPLTRTATSLRSRAPITDSGSVLPPARGIPTVGRAAERHPHLGQAVGGLLEAGLGRHQHHREGGQRDEDHEHDAGGQHPPSAA